MPRLFEGDKVHAHYTAHDAYYEATIVGKAEDGCDYIVKWDDGDTKDTVKPEHKIKLVAPADIPELAAGMYFACA